MILEQLEKLESRAQIARDDGSLRQDLGKIERMGERVASLGRSLRKVTTAYRELVDVKPAECSQVLYRLRSLKENLTATSTQCHEKPLFGATQEFAAQLVAEERLAKEVDKTLADAWLAYRNDQQRSTVDRELLQVLKRSGLDVGTLLENYDAACFGLEMLEAKALPGDGDVARLRSHVAALDGVAAGLSAVVPEALASFFRQTDSAQGAPLSALTPEVNAFLTQHGIAGRYSIRGRR